MRKIVPPLTMITYLLEIGKKPEMRKLIKLLLRIGKYILFIRKICLIKKCQFKKFNIKYINLYICLKLLLYDLKYYLLIILSDYQTAKKFI